MADKNHLKIADQVYLADDDPFAELTRIMGFDPRQPARQAPLAADPVSVSHEQAAEEDEFSLDLEKELLGSFDLEEEQAAPVADEAVEASFEAHEFETAPEMQEAEVPEADFEFSAAFEEAMAVPSEPTGSVANEDEPVFDADFDSAFAAAADDQSNGIEEEDGFDIGLTDEDIGGLDETPPPLPVTPEAVAADSEIGAELDAAMADFLTEAPSAETGDASFEAPVLDEAAAAPTQEAGDLDHGLFDENDFRIEDGEVTDESVPAIEAEPETQPEIDESAFQFDDLFRSDEDEPAVEEVAAAQEPAAGLSFDGLDFGDDEPAVGNAVADNIGTPAAEEPVEEAPVVAEASLGSTPGPASDFEFSVPPFVPRKLPTSPMDVAAEEFRQREAAEPAEPEFNLEDELNALLGNARSSQASSGTGAPAASADEPSTPEIPAYEPAPVSEAYQPFASNVFGSAAAQSGGGQDHGAPESLGFEAPEHPADIHDDLSWDLGDAFSEQSPESAEGHAQETYAQSDEIGEYVEDGQFDAYAEPGQAEDVYVQAFEAEEEPAPIELDDDFADGLDDDRPSESPYRDAFAGAGIGAAAGYGSSYAQRPFQATAAATGTGSFSPHRDPVVRGNPLKEDPLDVITQLAEKYSRKEPATPYGRAMSIASGASSVAYEPEETVGDLDISDAFEEPEVETVEVADQAIALADDFDIPELPEEELPPVPAYDDLDAEFSSLLDEMNAEQQAGKPAGGYGDPLAGGFSARPYENNVAATPHGARAIPAATYDGPEAAPYALDADDLPGSHVPAGAQYADDYEYDPDFDQEIAPEHLAGEGRQKPRSRGLLLAGLIGGVALLGGVGAFALSFGGGDDTPAIVKADNSPVKVRPADPGGATVPNQESKVYETVAGERNAAAAPQQETLVTTAEEPMDVMPPAVDDEQEAAVSGKSEDRIEQIVQEAANQTDDEIVAVAPRKVRTLVVKPDGTLVPREDEPEAAASEQTEAITAATPEAAPAAPIPESTGALPAETADNDPSPALAPPPDEVQAAVAPPPAPQEATDETEGQSEVTAAMPETVPIAPLRPADQPIDVVGEVKPDQVAAATTAAAGGGWAMQIASQPSEAAAQSSYENLARRYGGVLEGREVNIVRAEIPGKGTFWRVRVPAESRNEAINLCESYKSAGGNCFVSR